MKPQSLLLLGRRHRHALWFPALGVGVAGLSLVLILARAGAPPSLQLGTLTIVVAVALFVRLWPRRSVRDTARVLDAEAGAQNRFEAIAELGGRTDPLAQALREEVDTYAAQHPLPRSNGWLVALTTFAVLLVTNAVLLGPGWIQSMRSPGVVIAKAEETATPRATEVGVTAATLRWVTPSEEITAAAKEEVPLTVESQSGSGLKELTLHVARNGEPLPPIPVTSEVEAGTQIVSSVLRLEALDLQPFDVVTYFMRAERIRPPGTADPSWTPISSPLQFVQIERSGETIAGICSECSAGCLLDIVRRLKREQLGVLRDTVASAYDPTPRTDPAWADAVRLVEARESGIRKETAELLPQLEDDAIPVEAKEALIRAEKDAGFAAANLARIEPGFAIDPAGRALAQFAAAEKALAKSIVLKRQGEKPEDQPSDLPRRENTPAGRLERVAAEQRNVAEQLVARAEVGELLGQQERLAREIATLASERALPAEINEYIKTAAEAAKEAARQMKEDDTLAATEPATRAAQELGDAVNRLLATASARAVEDLLAAQRALIHAATELQLSELATTAEAARTATQRVTGVQQDARAAARQQQQQGSAAAAQRFNELAQAIGQSGVQTDLANLAQARATDATTQTQKETVARKLLHLAQDAADRASVLLDAMASQERAIDELRRTQANLDRVAKRDPSQAATDVGRDVSGVVDFYEKALANAQRLVSVDDRERGVPPPPGPGSTVREHNEYAAILSLRIGGLIRLATTRLADTGRTQTLTFGNPTDAPPAYRTAVAEYFETLARERAAKP